MGVEPHIVDPRFKALFKDTFGFNDQEYALLLTYFEATRIKKKEFLTKPGTVCNFKAYVNKGCLRNYVIDENGHEKILHFAFEDWWSADLDSYYSGKPGTIFIQALEDCELLKISKQDFQRLEDQIPNLKKWYTVKLTRNARKSVQRITEMKTMSLENRYLRLLKDNPQIFQRIPLQYIASYLNVEPQSLSRLRKRLMVN